MFNTFINWYKTYKQLVSKEDKLRSPLINYHLTIPKIYGPLKTHKPEILLRPIIFGIESAPTP